MEKINVVESGCWEWTVSLSVKGYGSIAVYGKHLRSHRFIYEYYHGEINPELTIDHLCRNRKCVNVIHLEQVTMAENVMRGISPSAINSRKTHCKRGHLFTSDNTYRNHNGKNCRICNLERAKKYQQDNRVKRNEYCKEWKRRKRISDKKKMILITT